jgi:hypothetical protein
VRVTACVVASNCCVVAIHGVVVGHVTPSAVTGEC